MFVVSLPLFMSGNSHKDLTCIAFMFCVTYCNLNESQRNLRMMSFVPY